MDWKIAATLIVAAGILVGAFLATSGVNFGGATGFFTAVTGGAKPTNISFAANLAPVDLTFTAPATTMVIKYAGPGAQFVVGSEKLDLSQQPQVEMSIEGWSGKVSISNTNTLTLDGTATKLTVNGISILPSSDRQRIAVTGLSFTSFKVTGLSLGGLKLPAASGFVDIGNGKTTFKADGEPLEFGNFNGELLVEPTLKLSGTTDRLLLAGQNKLSISQ
jgi:hypothetical protein